MKLYFRNSIVSLTLLVFIFSISGFTLYKHECLRSGVVHFSISEIQDCCEKKEVKEVKKPACCKKEEEHSKKKNCCTDSKFSKQLKADNKVSSHKTFVPACKELATAQIIFLPGLSSAKNSTGYTDPSPPLSGRDKLTLNQTFLI